ARVTRMPGDRLLVVADRSPHPGVAERAPVVAPPQVEVVGLGIDLGSGGEALALRRREREPDVRGDVARHLALQCEHVLQVPLVALRPQMTVARRLDELGDDSHAVAGPHDRALDDPAHAQLARDLRDGLLRALVLHHRGAGDTLSESIGASWVMSSSVMPSAKNS